MLIDLDEQASAAYWLDIDIVMLTPDRSTLGVFHKTGTAMTDGYSRSDNQDEEGFLLAVKTQMVDPPNQYNAAKSGCPFHLSEGNSAPNNIATMLLLRIAALDQATVSHAVHSFLIGYFGARSTARVTPATPVAASRRVRSERQAGSKHCTLVVDLFDLEVLREKLDSTYSAS